MAVPVSKAELEFTLQALRREGVRVDGRALAAYRRLGLKFGAQHGEVEVTFGPTRVLAVCSGEIVTPPPERPNEGRIQFHVEFGPIASPAFEVGRQSVQATAVANLIERLIKGSRAVDAEALCLVGGQKVWSIRVDVRALDDDGNLGDACAIAALCSLLHFRKKDVEVKGDSARVFSAEERVPVPLSIHHLPVPVTFALFQPSGGKSADPTWILDPNRLEESASDGTLCMAVNQHGELCGVHKPGGLPVDFALIQSCTDVAVQRAKELTAKIRSELDADMAKRHQARRNVHQEFSDAHLLTVNWDAPAVDEAEEEFAEAHALAGEVVSASAPLSVPDLGAAEAAAAATQALAAPAAAAAPRKKKKKKAGQSAALAAEAADADLAGEFAAVAAERAALASEVAAAVSEAADAEEAAELEKVRAEVAELEGKLSRSRMAEETAGAASAPKRKKRRASKPAA